MSRFRKLWRRIQIILDTKIVPTYNDMACLMACHIFLRISLNAFRIVWQTSGEKVGRPGDRQNCRFATADKYHRR